MKYSCPVCGFASLPYPPNDNHICPCCSTEFGNDDVDYSHSQLREMWIAAGARWFFGRPPTSGVPGRNSRKPSSSTPSPLSFAAPPAELLQLLVPLLFL